MVLHHVHGDAADGRKRGATSAGFTHASKSLRMTASGESLI
jgi:hypothetical protein